LHSSTSSAASTGNKSSTAGTKKNDHAARWKFGKGLKSTFTITINKVVLIIHRVGARF
jgi:hypothetical protein